MLKMLGKLQPAMEHYEKALAMYEVAVGTHHMSYYSTLANIGVLCKSMSESSSLPDDYQSLLNRAQESLVTALKGQRDLAGAIPAVHTASYISIYFTIAKKSSTDASHHKPRM